MLSLYTATSVVESSFMCYAIVNRDGFPTFFMWTGSIAVPERSMSATLERVEKRLSLAQIVVSVWEHSGYVNGNTVEAAE